MILSTNQFRINVILYILIAYAITWTILFPLIFYYNSLDLITREIWHSCGSLGPAMAGIIIIYKTRRLKGLADLKRKLIQFSGFRLFFLALSPLLILIISIIIEFFIGTFDVNQLIQLNQLNNFGLALIFILPSLCYGFFEELGWRGYLLPTLQKKKDALSSTLILTIFWWFWHFPAFFYRFDIFFALFLMLPLMLGGSIVFTYLFNQSNGSLLMVIILHVCYDLSTSHQISIIATILTSIFFIFLAIRIIRVYGSKKLSNNLVVL